MYKKILKIIVLTLICIVASVLSLFGVYYLFTGGIQALEVGIKTNGLWNTIIEFFKSLWQGVKTVLGF